MTDELPTYPAYKDSGLPWLGRIPEHWGLERLKGLVTNVNRQTCVTDGRTRYVALEHVESWTGRTKQARASSVNGLVKRFEQDDILFGKLRPYLAKVVHTTCSGVCVGEFFVLRRQDSRFDSGYGTHLLRSLPFVMLVNGATYGAKMPRVDWRMVGGCRIPVPPPEEQEAIVRYLDGMNERIDRFIRNRERLIELLTEQKRAVINHAVTKGLDPSVKLKPSGIDWLGDIPEHWDDLSLKRVLLRLIDCEHKTAPQVDHATGYKVIRTSAIRGGSLRWDGTYETTE